MKIKFLKRVFNYKVVLFLIVFIYLTLWIWQGIDLTDSGYNLTKQWMVFNGGIENQLDMLFGSSFIGGLWNSIIDGNYLVWSYFGSVLIGSLSVLFIYLILSNYFNKKITFLASISIVPLLVVPTIKVPNYNDIPLLIFLVVIYFINKSILTRNIKISNLFLIISGGFYSIAVISKFVLIIFLLFPIIIVIYNFYFRENKISWFKRSLFFISGLFIGLVIIFIILYRYNLLKIYLMNIYDSIFLGLLMSNYEEIPMTFTHDFKSILIYSLKYFYYTLILIPITLIFLGLYSYMVKIRNNIIKYSIITLYCIFIVWFIYTKFNSPGYYNYVYYIFFGLNFFIILFYLYKSKDKKVNFILLIVFFSQIIINFGSLVMNWNNMYLSTILSIILLFKVSKLEFSNDFKPFIKFVDFKKILIIILIAFGIVTNYYNIFRDNPNRFNLVQAFKTENLKYIFTTEQRATAIDGVVTKVKEYVESYDEILFTNNIPLLYYLTETKPVTNEAWALNLNTDEFFKKEITEILNDNPPGIIVVAKGSTRRDREWPVNVEKIKVHPRNEDKLMFIYESIEKFNYKLDWENEGFELYRK